VGGLVVQESDEVIAIKVSGQITRSAVAEVPAKGRDTMGVKFVGVADDDAVSVIALNPESTEEENGSIDPEVTPEGTVDPQEAPVATAADELEAEEEKGD
jgi:DNA gyrase subunit A